MKKFFVTLIINAIALYAAVYIMNGNGITPQSTNWLSFAWLALIFGIINALLKPILTVVGCPIIVLTLGLGSLLINTLLFYLAGLIGSQFGVGFSVSGFLPAFLGALIVSVVSMVLNMFVKEDR